MTRDAKAEPTDFAAIVSQFHEDGEWLEFFAQIRWAAGFRCPRCGFRSAWSGAAGMRICKRPECGRKTSPTVGTVLDRIRDPSRVCHAAWLLVSRPSGTTAKKVQRECGFHSYSSAWKCLHRLRRAMLLDEDPLLEPVEEAYTDFNTDVEEPVTLVRFSELATTTRKAGRVRLCRWASPRYVAISRSLPGERQQRHAFTFLELSGRLRDLRTRYRGAITSEHFDAYIVEVEFLFNCRELSPYQTFLRLLQLCLTTEPGTDTRGTTD